MLVDKFFSTIFVHNLPPDCTQQIKIVWFQSLNLSIYSQLRLSSSHSLRDCQFLQYTTATKMVTIVPLRALLFVSLHLVLMYQFIISTVAIDPTKGFTALPLKKSNFDIQRPYDVPENQRYSFKNGVHKLWVYSNDKPHSPTSNTKPRTEIRIQGYDYNSGVWQFEAYGFVPSGTSGVSIMQVFGAQAHASTLMLRVYKGTLSYYRAPVIIPHVYDKWFRLNVIHDVEGNTVKVFVDGKMVRQFPGRGGKSHYFKCGVYAQDDSSRYMESRWKNIRVFKKT